jgi:hypothetical protein
MRAWWSWIRRGCTWDEFAARSPSRAAWYRSIGVEVLQDATPAGPEV